MSKITDFAANQPCTCRIPGICNHNPSTSSWAHLNSIRWGSGRGKKSPDICGLIACFDCHGVIDGRVKTDHDRDYIKTLAYEGHLESLMLLHKAGII